MRARFEFIRFLAAPAMAAACLTAPARAQSAETPPQHWETVAATDIRYFAWHGTRGYPTNGATGAGSGAELYIPFAAQITGKPGSDLKVELVARGGWVWARQSTAGLAGVVATSTDSSLSGTVTYLGWNGFQPFVSLASNLPTGRSQLFGTAANARMDPDLVEISSFGEGFNIGPTLGFNLPVSDSLIFTGSAGYTWRGAFAREDGAITTSPFLLATNKLDPGDVLTLTGALAYAAGPVTANFVASASMEGTTTQDGLALFRAGRRYMLTGTLAYNWGPSGLTTFSAATSHSDNNSVLFLHASSLAQEPLDTNSNLYRIGIEHLFPIDNIAVGPVASFLFRDRNGYDSATLQFVPAKQRWSTGIQARYAASDTVTLSARVEGVWTFEDGDPADADRKFSVLANAYVPGSAVPQVSSTGLQTAIGLNVKF